MYIEKIVKVCYNAKGAEGKLIKINIDLFRGL